LCPKDIRKNKRKGDGIMPDMVKVENLKKNFGDLEVLKDISLTVKEGEKLVIIGPSGSGKSTFIRCINYLEEPTSGKITVAGTEVTKKNHLEMAKKYSSMVFQQFNLYPHLTVLENLTLAPIKLQHVPKEEAKKNAIKCLERLKRESGKLSCSALRWAAAESCHCQGFMYQTALNTL